MSYIYKLSEDVAPSLRDIFEERGWIAWNENIHEENEWNILWTTKRHFKLVESFTLNTFQKLNHFHNTSQITFKDKLTRNLKRMRANFGKIYNFYPKSYQFPLQYSEFVAMTQRKRNKICKNTLSTSLNGNIQSSSINRMLRKQRKLLNGNTYLHNKYKKKEQRKVAPPQSLSANIGSDSNENKSIWIAKPASGRRGENITLFTDVSTLNYNQPMIIQKYISNPLLIGGYKFDLRIYVLVTSIRPLQIFCYNDGLCRFSTQQYDLNNLNNIYSHLTNSSINKSSDTFNTNKLVIGEGCQWSINKLIEYLQKEIDNEYNIKMMSHNINGKEYEMKKIDIRKKIWGKIHDMIILTILPIIMDVEQCSNCFELFGFDVLVDEKYNCWLLEVNGSPAIAITSKVDRPVKYPMLNDLIDCVQSQFGPMIQNTKYKKYSSSKHSRCNSIDVDDTLSERLKDMDVSGCKEEDEAKSFETIEIKETNVFQNDVGGFEEIFPFNANTYESNKILTNVSNDMISRAQKFKKIVVSEIKKRRCNKA